MATQHRSHATISGEDLYRRVIETARSGKRLPAGALLDADNYSDFIRAVTNANNMDGNTAAVVRRYLGLAHSVQLDPVQEYDRFYHRLFNIPHPLTTIQKPHRDRREDPQRPTRPLPLPAAHPPLERENSCQLPARLVRQVPEDNGRFATLHSGFQHAEERDRTGRQD